MIRYARLSIATLLAPHAIRAASAGKATPPNLDAWWTPGFDARVRLS